MTGIVINRNVNRGQTVAASLYAPTLFTMAQDLKRMQVEAAIVEADVRLFAVGQAVAFTVDAHPGRRFRGEVRQIRKAAQSNQNVVTYTVVIAADNADEALLPGMTANLQVVVAERENALVVPNSALRFRPSEDGKLGREPERAVASIGTPEYPVDPGTPGQVFMVDTAGKPAAVPLRLGITDGRFTEVLAGNLPPGARVITATARPPEEAISPGAKFRLR